MKRAGLAQDDLEGFIVEAFFELLDERPFPQVTVVDLVARAGVSRSTYYRRFSTRESVAKRFVEEMLDEALAEFDETASSVESGRKRQKQWLCVLFATMGRDLARLELLTRNGLSPLFLDVLNERFALAEGEESEGRYRLRYHLGGLYNCFTQWIACESRMSPEEMADLAMAFLPKGMPTLPLIEERKPRP